VSEIFIEDLAFDYAHFIPGHPHCGLLHGHTSVVEVRVWGPVDELGMIIDFADLKKTVNWVLSDIDHRVFIDRSLSPILADDSVAVTWEARGRHFTLSVPRGAAVLLDGPSTIENITQYLAEKCAEALMASWRISGVAVTATEGFRKGATYSVVGRR